MDNEALGAVPDWAKDAVWYQIFVERFRNGEPASNPLPEDIGASGVAGWELMDWGADWYACAPWEDALGGFHRSVYLRRYGGDLIGVRDKLDYLQDLGVNAIYLNPIFMAPSLHKYDGSSFHHIDPTFGPDCAGDRAALDAAQETEDPSTWIWTAADRYFLDLIRDIHRRGMRVILDGVFNHTGREFFAFKDLLKHGRASAYRDWYRVTGWKGDGSPRYKGWFNHASLPELGRWDHNLAGPVKEYIFHITRRWMDPDGDGDPSDGVDGWRLDVAFCVPSGFWRDWARWVRQINPEAYLTGEIVGLADSYLQGDIFDAVMNYMWLYPTVEFFSPGDAAIGAQALREKLERLDRAYPEANRFVLQNLLDSHDVARIASMLENPSVPKASWEDYFEASRVKHARGFVTSRPGRRAYDALKQMGIFQMTYQGAPMIYYGTEVGMWGANDPDNRQPMFWEDIAYEPETRGPAGEQEPRERSPDRELLQFYRRAIAFRKEHDVFRRGALRWLDTGQSRLLGFDRTSSSRCARVLLNASDQPAVYRLHTEARDLWNPGHGTVSGTVSIEPRGWRVLELPKAS